ncbi:O-acyltransferase [Gregarina niphandrodes]|uniref:diacylglycerol O-acyltransferase n=1 Tax=Gregarina niphandrodes TaxID=110365 RepID=A0A023B1F0_GRENI|nr:O-acyltransferase [Gregarina niphandrodes]EZG46769.1 O-acyltransferase [Gregarina niphandrodes]|eukprot:XP_011132278.1 O-acyltransferase [Gregarina niphandrodes]
MLSCTWMLKMISFHHTLHDLRLIILSDTTSLTDIIPFDDERASYLHYPYSLSLKHFVVYLIAPTLCFQFNYPRRKDRDWQKIGKAALQLAFSLILLKIIYEQYVTKVLENTFTLRYGGEDGMKMVLHMVERLMKLSIPTLYCWLLMFLSFFHYWMMFLAEITRFEDQQFYREWWNATSLEEYWRRWNLPVHHFCIRHVYIPLISHGWSRTVANQTVFLLSALAHEYIVAGSLKLGWTGLVFLAFVMQTPLSILTSSKYIQARPKLGNSIFWIVFCFTGQPMGVLIFYYLWNVKAGLLQPIDTTQVFKPAPPF